MIWLDSKKHSLNCNPSELGVPRGKCDVDDRKPEQIRMRFQNVEVTYTRFKVRPHRIDAGCVR
ncbi:hypothetical protein F4806DRAFT_445635 [Annulohypoxylon nitens]|nr:hypothetical protein F4806DRAFT_445635 [Annulohypoxylon nitens]